MALTESNMMQLGTLAPDFKLLDVFSDKFLTLNDLRGQHSTVIMFVCNHCPYVIHVNPEILRISNDYKNLGVNIIAISSNDEIEYPQDGPQQMKIHGKNIGYDFPYLFDETQEVARAYEAACTPDFYVFDQNLRLAYRGRLDDSRPRVETPKPLTGSDLRGALNAILANEPISEIQFPSMGCNIKWRKNDA